MIHYLWRVVHGLAASIYAVWAVQAIGASAGMLSPPDIPLWLLAVIMMGLFIRASYRVIFGEEP